VDLESLGHRGVVAGVRWSSECTRVRHCRAGVWLPRFPPRRHRRARLRRKRGVEQSVLMDDRAFTKLLDYLTTVPAVNPTLSHGDDGNGRWWVQLSIDIDHSLAWNVVQELAYVLNDLSLTERLPTVFKPMSPPPYLNGGPREYLWWVIEATTPDMRPSTCADWLESRLPRPVGDLSQWTEE
jgi:hypothetical protein